MANRFCRYCSASKDALLLFLVLTLLLLYGEGVAGVNGVVAPSSGGTLTAGYPVQPTNHLATHPMPEHTSALAPQFAGNFYISYFANFITVVCSDSNT